MRFSLTLLTLALCTGCGTIVNLQYAAPIDAPDKPDEVCGPYGGVTLSAHQGISYITVPISPAHGMTALCPFVALYFLGIDAPLSLIGDTVTLPIAAIRFLQAVKTENETNTH